MLGHLANNYQSLPSKLSKKLLRETVLSFRNTNDDSRAQDRILKDGHEICEKHCEVESSIRYTFEVSLIKLIFLSFSGFEMIYLNLNYKCVAIVSLRSSIILIPM